jgi:hypothetical protein
MQVKDIIKAGPKQYTHHYMGGTESIDHTLEVPKHLTTIATKHNDAKVVIYGDDTLGIEIDGRLWAAEMPHNEMRPAKTLPHEVWQYCNLAMGRNGDTHARTY